MSEAQSFTTRACGDQSALVMEDADDLGIRRNFDFYGPQYRRFDTELSIGLRREVYGEDIGQQGWRSVVEQNDIARLLRAGPGVHILDIACGSGGPSVALAEKTGCRVTGIDVEPAGIAYAQSRAYERGLAERATFLVQDCGGPLPFPDATFDAVVCIDAICHLPDRTATLLEWTRLLRPGGRVLFSDPVVLTGPVAKPEFDVRTGTGFFLLVPPGINEGAIKDAGLILRVREDRTAAMAEIAGRWHDARARHADPLRRDEGTTWFEQRQQFLAVTAELSRSRRLSRFFYVAERP